MRAHRNNIGVARLVLACLVIVGHAPELIDGNRVREPMIRLFHTVSLGELSVDGFFILSGYLITASMLRSDSWHAFLVRRILRIYPAFIVASLLSVFAFGPLLGAEPWHFLAGTGVKIVTLQAPIRYPGQLVGMPYPALNGAMWSIGVEFRCYLLVAVLGVCGLLKRRGAMVALAVCFSGGAIVVTAQEFSHWLDGLTGYRWVYLPLGATIPSTIRLVATFLVGSCFYLFRNELAPILRPRYAALCILVATALLYHDPHFAEVGLTIFGGLALFWFATRADIGSLRRINDEWDISYGVYLYGWPVATLILWCDRAISPSMLAASTLLVALAFGAASWWGVEKWTKDLFRLHRAGTPSPIPSAASVAFAKSVVQTGRF